MWLTIYLLTLCIVLFGLCYTFFKKNEKFNNDFDKILDFKCRSVDSSLNNYLGPWDDANGRCSKYACPTEMCSSIARDTSLSTKYGNSYTWVTEILSKTMANDDQGNVTCTTNHNKQHPNNNTLMNCEETRMNAPDHNATQSCYDFDGTEWKETKYIKILNDTGIYSWKNVASVMDASTTKTDAEMESCKKEPPVDCSLQNYYCCKLPQYPDACYNRLPNINDQYVEYIPNPNATQDGEAGMTCITMDDCDIDECRAGTAQDEYGDTINDKRKDCWQYDSFTKEWKNNVFRRTYHNGECTYINEDYVVLQDDFYTGNICSSNAPLYTNESCARDNINITCGFLDDNEMYYTKEYKPRLDYSGDKCVYTTEDWDDVLLQSSGTDAQPVIRLTNYPSVLPDNDQCPELSPMNCKNPDVDFLKFVNEDNTMRCSPCPEGSFRNDNMATFFESEACTPIATCPKLNECTAATCQTCLKRIDSQDTQEKPDKYEIVYIEQEPDRDTCVVKDDSFCEKDNDGSYPVCPAQKVLRINDDTRLCDNCPSDHALKIDGDGSTSCERVYDCTNIGNTLCLIEDTNNFDMHVYDNETDKFSQCVWKPLDDTGDAIRNCETQCPQYHYRVTHGNRESCTQALTTM
ncbi:hypothetical protein QKU58_gp068 [Pyramimonas orientalis virus]|uniref:Uncharacterized protein n=1 Tax=Pyramimonas orientalis virus 01B TaxID=3134525 RepID=A0A7M3UNK0_9VIRU|nr:hypothetical protein QKU58_gp068 [Pyramimonas orientalis virus]QOI90263.1 hypothetical protein HWQ62_00126 [Pyramimonas orientalis virus]